MSGVQEDQQDDTYLLKANAVLQVHKSHLSRIEDFLSTFQPSNQVKIISREKSASKTCSLMFLSVNDIKDFAERLTKMKFVYQALNKSYVLLSSKSLLGSIEDKTSGKLLQLLQKERDNDNASKSSKMVVKIDTFPPKIQRTAVINLLEELDTNNIPPEELDISPTNYTHTLSIIQVRKEEKGVSASYLIGIAPVEHTIPTIHKIKDSNDDVCRAYYKLAEAFQRYKSCHESNDWPFHNTSAGSKRKNTPILGIDCGAAPGGWTKYLIEQTACDEVYSIDPGKLSGHVLSIPNVTHLQMTGQNAIPNLSEVLTKRDGLVSIWVSDMCVHEVSKQVDMFLLAKSSGLFQANAAFVLTIKCNVGHAKERFDELTEREVVRLKEAGAYDVLVLHLFSNRIGERTVIGYIK